MNGACEETLTSRAFEAQETSQAKRAHDTLNVSGSSKFENHSIKV